MYDIFSHGQKKRIFLDDNTALGRELNKAKFDVHQIQNAN